MLTLIFTPSMLALRIWIGAYLLWMERLFARLSMGRSSEAARDWALISMTNNQAAPKIIWSDILKPTAKPKALEAAHKIALPAAE